MSHTFQLRVMRPSANWSQCKGRKIKTYLFLCWTGPLKLYLWIYLWRMKHTVTFSAFFTLFCLYRATNLVFLFDRNLFRKFHRNKFRFKIKTMFFWIPFLMDGILNLSYIDMFMKWLQIIGAYWPLPFFMFLLVLG